MWGAEGRVVADSGCAAMRKGLSGAEKDGSGMQLDRRGWLLVDIGHGIVAEQVRLGWTGIPGSADGAGRGLCFWGLWGVN